MKISFVVLFYIALISCSQQPSVEITEKSDNRSKPVVEATFNPLLFSKYTDKINSNSKKLRERAARITYRCKDDLYCKMVKIFRFVQKKRYLSDPVGSEMIQEPEYTLRIRAGDCEDLAILFVSLMRNIGVDAYLVTMKGHMLAGVCGIDKPEYVMALYQISPNLYDYRSHNKMIKQPGYYFFSINNNYTEYPLSIQVKANKPVDIDIYENREEHNELLEDGSGMAYQFCNESDVEDISMECELEKGNVLNITTKEKYTRVIVNTHLSKQFIEDRIMTFEKDGETCIYVDPTVQGENLFPGLLTESVQKADKHLLIP